MDRSEFRTKLDDFDKHLSEVDRQRIIDKNIEYRSKKEIFIVAMEELSELQKEISKYLRNFDDPDFDTTGLIEEYADVSICLKEIRSILVNSGENFDDRRSIDQDFDNAIDIKLTVLDEKNDENRKGGLNNDICY